jgi:hypothetical protein
MFYPLIPIDRSIRSRLSAFSICFSHGVHEPLPAQVPQIRLIQSLQKPPISAAPTSGATKMTVLQ